MAFSEVFPSSNSRNSDLSCRNNSFASIMSRQLKQESSADRSRISGGYGVSNDGIGSTISVGGLLRDVYGTHPSSITAGPMLLDASVTLMDAPGPASLDMLVDFDQNGDQDGNSSGVGSISAVETRGKSVDEVWREIVSGERKEMKEEAQEGIVTLEDFLAKAAEEEAVGTAESENLDMNTPPERLSGGVYAFDSLPHTPFQMVGKVEGSTIECRNGLEVYGNGGRGRVRDKRARTVTESVDKAAVQRQKRMIKNRESAARSRERKQAYQAELESLVAKLEEENEQLLREKEERTKERYKKLMEEVIPVTEKRRPPRVLRGARSLEW